MNNLTLNFNVAMTFASAEPAPVIEIGYLRDTISRALELPLIMLDLSRLGGATPVSESVAYVANPGEFADAIVFDEADKQPGLTQIQKDLLNRAFAARPHRSALVEHISPTMQIIDGLPAALGTDPHRARAADVLGIKPEDVTHEQRIMGKAINYAQAYTPAGTDPVKEVTDRFLLTFTDEQKERVRAYIKAQRTDAEPNYKAIANELFDALHYVNQRLQQGLMGNMSGRLADELPELLDRVEAQVKDK